MKMLGLPLFAWLFILFGLLAIHAVFLVPALLCVDMHSAADYGVFINGYIGTTLLLVSVALLYATLAQQTEEYKRSQVESRVFELIKYQRENVVEIELGRRSGGRTFVLLVREFRATLLYVNVACGRTAQNYPKRMKIDLAYMAFYYGTGPNSDRVLKSSIAYHDNALVETLISILSDPAVKNAVRRERDFAFKPFEGHQSRLGHYFRHLFQTIKYIDKNADSKSAIEYANLLRSQLSNHEQALLFLNSLTPLGEAWRTSGLLVKYQLIKNIPKDFFDSDRELDPKAVYPAVIFEYEQHAVPFDEPNRSEAD
jgi:hypothetical protein